MQVLRKLERCLRGRVDDHILLAVLITTATVLVCTGAISDVVWGSSVAGFATLWLAGRTVRSWRRNREDP